jgi:hypothetical protein
MTMRDLGPQALVYKRNTCYQQHQFLMKGLGDMSLDGQTDGHNGKNMLPRNVFGEHKNCFPYCGLN